MCYMLLFLALLHISPTCDCWWIIFGHMVSLMVHVTVTRRTYHAHFRSSSTISSSWARSMMSHLMLEGCSTWCSTCWAIDMQVLAIWNDGRYHEDAIKYYKMSIDICGDHCMTEYNIGLCYYSRGAYLKVWMSITCITEDITCHVWIGTGIHGQVYSFGC